MAPDRKRGARTRGRGGEGRGDEGGYGRVEKKKRETPRDPAT